MKNFRKTQPLDQAPRCEHIKTNGIRCGSPVRLNKTCTVRPATAVLPPRSSSRIAAPPSTGMSRAARLL